MSKDQLVGTWRLVSSEYRGADGNIVKPFGDHHVGMIMFDASGHVMAVSGNADRPHFADGDRRKGTPEEVKAALDGFNAYFGTYEVDLDRHVITLHIELMDFPNQTGSVGTREYEVLGDRLVLRPLQGSALTASGEVVWKRVG